MSQILANHVINKNEKNQEIGQPKGLTYKVNKQPNAYVDLSAELDQNPSQTVQIQVMDLLFNDQVCSLVYMHDITSLIQESESRRYATLKNLLKQVIGITDLPTIKNAIESIWTELE